MDGGARWDSYLVLFLEREKQQVCALQLLRKIGFYQLSNLLRSIASETVPDFRLATAASIAFKVFFENDAGEAWATSGSTPSLAQILRYSSTALWKSFSNSAELFPS